MIVRVEHPIFRIRNSILSFKLVTSSWTQRFYQLYTSTPRHNTTLAHYMRHKVCFLFHGKRLYGIYNIELIPYYIVKLIWMCMLRQHNYVSIFASAVNDESAIPSIKYKVVCIFEDWTLVITRADFGLVSISFKTLENLQKSRSEFETLIWIGFKRISF